MALANETVGAPSGAPTLTIYCNTPDEVLFSNVRSACARGYPHIKQEDPLSLECGVVICGSGPSISHDIEEIRAMRANHSTIVALNGAAEFLCQHGIRPDIMVMIDARDHNVQFLVNDVADKYIIASQCSPVVFDRLDELGADVKIFHALIDRIDDQIPPDVTSYSVVGGGITVGLTSLALMFTVGFRRMDLFGFDSSYSEEELYVAPQIMNAGESEVIEAKVGFKTFKTSPLMAKQAMEFQNFSKMLSNAGCEITVHGTGLLPAIAWAMTLPGPTATLDGEISKYERMWAEPQYRVHSPGEEWFSEIMTELKLPSDGEGIRIIDFGCGPGRLTNQFQAFGYDAIGVDFADNCLDDGIKIPLMVANLWDLPHILGDFGVCCDVMEHIPPEHVDATLSNIRRSVAKAFFSISSDHDSCGQLIGETLHLSVHPAEWWEAKLKDHWRDVRRVGSNGFVVS